MPATLTLLGPPVDFYVQKYEWYSGSIQMIKLLVITAVCTCVLFFCFELGTINTPSPPGHGKE